MHTSSVTNIPTILKTATAKVTSGETVMDTTILFDEGSQRSFITEELAQNLNLKQTGTETLTIAAFGGKERMRTFKTSTLFLIADSGENIQIHVVVVPCIAAKIHSHQVPIKNLPYLQHLKLAQSYDGSSFEVSLLIGVNHYWDIVGNNIIRGPGSIRTNTLKYKPQSCCFLQHLVLSSPRRIGFRKVLENRRERRLGKTTESQMDKKCYLRKW
jgi:hypothetical protein